MKGTKRFAVTVEWHTQPTQYDYVTHRQTLVCCDKTTIGEILEWANQWTDCGVYDIMFSSVGTFDDGWL